LKKILVIGSLNMDLVSHVPHLPRGGETISSLKFQKNPGGKGANQAAAAAKLGADVAMIGKVGHDDYGKQLLETLREAGVDTAGIQQEGTTGMAFINVSSEGENNIVLVPGANHTLTKSDINKLSGMMDQSDFILMQLEIPLDVVEYVIKLADEKNKQVILNPAPAQTLEQALLSKVHTLVPNETELNILTGMPTTTHEEITQAAQTLLNTGVKKLIVTMGEKGSYLIEKEKQVHIPAYHVKAVDTTAAGDSFIAAFATGLAKGMEDVDAAKFAAKVSAIVVTKEGAQPSLPTLEEVASFSFAENE